MANELGFYLSPARGVQEIEIVRIFETRAMHDKDRVYWVAEIIVADRLTGLKVVEVAARNVYRDTPENRAAFAKLVELNNNFAELKRQIYEICDPLTTCDPSYHRGTVREAIESTLDKYVADMKEGGWAGESLIIYDDASPLNHGTTTGPIGEKKHG